MCIDACSCEEEKKRERQAEGENEKAGICDLHTEEERARLEWVNFYVFL